MANENTFTRLRGAFRNSLVWGVAWGAFGTAGATAMRLIDKIPFANALLERESLGVGEAPAYRKAERARSEDDGFR